MDEPLDDDALVPDPAGVYSLPIAGLPVGEYLVTGRLRDGTTSIVVTPMSPA